MADRKQLTERLRLVEEALADYMMKFGATELARIAMIRSVIDEMVTREEAQPPSETEEPTLPPWLIDATRRR